MVHGRWRLLVQHLLLFLAFLFLLLRFCLRFGLGQLATGLGDGDCLLAVGVVEGSLQAPSSGLQSRVQITFSPGLELVFALRSKLLFPVAGDLTSLGLHGLFTLSSGTGALAGAQPTVPTGGYTHTPLPFSTVRLLHLLFWFLFLSCFSGVHSCQDENKCQKGSCKFSTLLQVLWSLHFGVAKERCALRLPLLIRERFFCPESRYPSRWCSRRPLLSAPARPVTPCSLSSTLSTPSFPLLCGSLGGIFGLEGGEPDPASDWRTPCRGGDGREMENGRDARSGQGEDAAGEEGARRSLAS